MWRQVALGQAFPLILLSGLFAGGIGGLILGSVSEPILGVYMGGLIALLSILINLVFSGLRSGLESGMVDEKILTAPNQGIRLSVMNSLRVGLWSALLVGLIGVTVTAFLGEVVQTWPIWHLNRLLDNIQQSLFIGSGFGFLSGLLMGSYDRSGGEFFNSSIRPQYTLFYVELLLNLLIVLLSTFVIILAVTIVSRLEISPLLLFLCFLLSGPSFGMLLGFVTGGFACLKHLFLRWFLWLCGAMTWDYPRFLNKAVELGFLQKIGGGYSFIHPLFLSYFAELDMNEWGAR